jgi:hypothetical protein
MPPNPYATGTTAPHESHQNRAYLASMPWGRIGFAMAASFPFVIGILSLRNELATSSVHTTGSGTCGMGLLAAIMLITVVAPVFGTIGGLVGWLIGISTKRLG